MLGREYRGNTKSCGFKAPNHDGRKMIYLLMGYEADIAVNILSQLYVIQCMMNVAGQMTCKKY